MENIITITLDDKNHKHKIEFDSSPTVSELVAVGLIIQEVLEHNFDKQSIFNMIAPIYGRLSDIEEVVRGEDYEENIT